MPTIHLDHLSKRYGQATALGDIHLTIPEHSFTALLGPSGCGKSTTLRLIAGLDTPTSGRILIGDRDVTHVSAAQRRLAMVFQSYALFPHLSVRENILFGLRVRKEPRRPFDSRLARVAGMLGLEGLLDRKPAQLSGGQQQRVALARAVISEASICLMDEPLSNLDAQLRQEMRREIRALQQSLGMTMIYVTHDQTEAMSMADQVVLMRAGQIEQQGSPAQLYASPRTTFSARFIGSPPMNLIELDTLQGTRVIRGTHGPALFQAPRQATHLGIRPEHIALDPSGYPAQVQTVEYFGADSILVCRVGGANGVALRHPGHATLRAGDAIRIVWHESHARYFDAQGIAIDALRPGTAPVPMAFGPLRPAASPPASTGAALPA